MLFLFKNIHIKQAFFPLLISMFVFSTLAQSDNFFGNESFEEEEEEEDIACKDLPTALNRYNQDVQLNQQSLKFALRRLADFLRSISDDNKVVRSKLFKMIEDLEEAEMLSQDNEMSLSSRGHNIFYFLEECLKISH